MTASFSGASGDTPLPEFLESRCGAAARDAWLGRRRVLEITQAGPGEWWRPPVPEGSQEAVAARMVLQRIGDYRGAIAAWFRAVRRGGILILAVPHQFLYERKAALPSRWSKDTRRFYTPASLQCEIEEALEPNSYRLRHLADTDTGFDYARGPEQPPSGSCEIVAVIEKITPPTWQLDFHGPEARAGGVQVGVRVEHAVTPPSAHILVLKLDHLGDFVMGTAALRKLREHFPRAWIELVCGAWNLQNAHDTGLFDQVTVFNALPANPSEGGRESFEALAARFRGTVGGRYDIAIDLRVDPDTRVYLTLVDAAVKAGIGRQSSFPYLDVFLPLADAESRLGLIPPDRFMVRPLAVRQRGYCAEFRGWRRHSGGGALLWGPYYQLQAGEYRFEPYFETHALLPFATIRYDLALDLETLQRGRLRVGGGRQPALSFRNQRPGARFEFRMWARSGWIPPVRFFGARLYAEGVETVDVLHQSEALLLLVDLLAARASHSGILRKAADA